MLLRALRRLAASSLLVALFLYPAASAYATFTLALHEDGYTDKTITFSPAPGGGAGQAQVINYAGSFGGFDIVMEVATSNSNLPGQTPTLTINDLQLTSDTDRTQTLRITVQDTGFSPLATGAGPVGLASQLSDTQLPLGSRVTFQSFLNGAAGSPLSLNSYGAVQDLTAVTAPSNPFTLTNVTTVTVGGASVVQTTGITRVLAPEPGTMGAVVSALPLFGLGLWRRWRTKG